MCSDVNHRMYRSGQNQEQIRFKHIFNSSVDKLWKRTDEDLAGISSTDLTYVKILIKGTVNSDVSIPVGDCNIEMRVRLFNQYKDMKVLTGTPYANLPVGTPSIPLN
jgi:hypothetical protein